MRRQIEEVVCDMCQTSYRVAPGAAWSAVKLPDGMFDLCRSCEVDKPGSEVMKALAKRLKAHEEGEDRRRRDRPRGSDFQAGGITTLGNCTCLGTMCTCGRRSR